MKHTCSNVGIIGASGSYQSYYRSALYKSSWKWDRSKSVNENIRRYKKMLKAAFWWSRYFADFPNPHVRTNGFLIKRSLFLSIRHKHLKDKFMAYVFESGKNSMTNQVLRKGLSVLLVDRSGNTYQMDQWSESNIFWQNSQSNLLISDNQTHMYNMADTATKQRLTYLAWGKNE